MAKDRGLKSVYFVQTLGGELTPRLLYRVTADGTPAGKRELVRGAVLDDIDQRALRSGIAAAGKDLFVANYYGDVPVTVMAPALLLEDATVRRANAEKRKAALLSATGVSFMKSLDLWCAYPDDLLEEEVAEACAAVVSEEELARCQRFRFENNRREALTTRALSRTALSHYHPLPPQAWRFTANAQGKPAIDPVIDPDCKLKFNLSNSPGLVVCLISDGAEVGVDVESFARAGRILELAPEVFSALERAGLDRLPEIANRPGADRPGRALSLWTLKEAYIKARGHGACLAAGQNLFPVWRR